MLSSARRISSACAFCLFAYGNANWKDRLTAVNGVGITYDRIGSPLNDAAWTCTWPPASTGWPFPFIDTAECWAYNENGLRVW